MNLFKGKRIRSFHHGKSGKRWFSVVDVCAAITNSDYQKARNYWKWLKAKLKKQKNETVSVTTQMKFEAADGKMRKTDVMDAEGILCIINACPSPKAAAFKLWLAELDAKGESAEEAISSAIPKIKCRVSNLLYIVTRTVIYDSKVHGPLCDYALSLPSRFKNPAMNRNDEGDLAA